MTPFSPARWICPAAFATLSPVDLFHKQLDKKEIPLPKKLQNLHIHFRKSFVLPAMEGSYRLRITADDYYKLKVNGKRVCQGPAQGYFFHYYWNEIDLAPYLVQGENLLEAEVCYQGLINRAYNSGDCRMGLIALLTHEGLPLLFTDESWECALSDAYTVTHTVGYDTMFAENFDSRKTLGPWEKAKAVDTDHLFSPKPATLLQVYEKYPVTVRPIKGGLFLDFGEEITAGLRLKAVGKDGAQVRILCGEEDDENYPFVRYQMRCNCHCEELWTLREGESLLEQYDYRAFRYVALLFEEGTEVTSIAATVRHYPFDDAYCRLETENAKLQSIWRICKNGVKYGSQEVFVDCPLREKGQYAGDLTVTSASHLILTGDLSLFEKAVDNQMQSAFICKGLMAVTPGSLMQEIADYSLQFPILALRHFAYTGDRDYLKKCYEISCGIIEHFRRYEQEDGLLEGVEDKWNLVDWPKNLRDNYDFPLESVLPRGSGVHNVVNAFYVGCVLQTEEIARILGIKGEERGESLKKAFYDAFFCEETGLFTDSPTTRHSSLHANVIPAFYGIHRPEEEEAIRTLIMGKGLCCGVYMAYFVLKALCRMGFYEDALALILSEEEHSWYNMVREGATCCFEAWGKEQKWNTSLCHPWASAPISVLAEEILPRLPHVGRLVYQK